MRQSGMRYWGTGGILAGVIIWLVASYVPALADWLPDWRFDPAWTEPLFGWLAVTTLILFLFLQGDLLRVTARWFDQPRHTPLAKTLNQFGLRRTREIFWTALPLLATALLLWWLLIGYPLT